MYANRSVRPPPLAGGVPGSGLCDACPGWASSSALAAAWSGEVSGRCRGEEEAEADAREIVREPGIWREDRFSRRFRSALTPSGDIVVELDIIPNVLRGEAPDRDVAVVAAMGDRRYACVAAAAGLLLEFWGVPEWVGRGEEPCRVSSARLLRRLWRSSAAVALELGDTSSPCCCCCWCCHSRVCLRCGGATPPSPCQSRPTSASVWARGPWDDVRLLPWELARPSSGDTTPCKDATDLGRDLDAAAEGLVRGLPDDREVSGEATALGCDLCDRGRAVDWRRLARLKNEHMRDSNSVNQRPKALRNMCTPWQLS